MASALRCFLVLVIVALSGATADQTETDSTTTTTITSTTITSTTTLTTTTLTSTTITTSSQANETTRRPRDAESNETANETDTSVTVSTTTESQTATNLTATEASTTAANETITTTTQTVIANDTSTTQTQTAVANETTTMQTETAVANATTTTQTVVANETSTTQTQTVVANESTTTQTETVVVNETSTTQTETAVANETTTTQTDTAVANETTTTQTDRESSTALENTSQTITATSTTSATRSTFTTIEGTSMEAVSKVQGLVTLSVSSAADAEELAGDEGVVEGWRAAFARAAGVAVDRVELEVSVVAGRRLRSMRGLAGATSADFGWGRATARGLAATARLTLEYAITQAADSEAIAKEMSSQVVTNIAELTEEELLTILAGEVERATGGSGPAVQVESIGDPTEEIVFRLITATETTTPADSGTHPAKQERSWALSMAPGACQALATVAVLLWSL